MKNLNISSWNSHDEIDFPQGVDRGTACDPEEQDPEGAACGFHSDTHGGEYAVTKDPQGAACDFQPRTFAGSEQDLQGAACDFQSSTSAENDSQRAACDFQTSTTGAEQVVFHKNKRPIPVFKLDKIVDMSILEETAVGASNPKRHMICSPDDTTRKPMKVMHKEYFYDALDEDLGIGQLWIEDNTEGLEVGGEKDVGVSTIQNDLPPKRNVKKKRSPRFKMAGKMGKGTGTRLKWGKVLSGQSLIVDHFDKKG